MGVRRIPFGINYGALSSTKFLKKDKILTFILRFSEKNLL